jgi:urease gamma subunit
MIQTRVVEKIKTHILCSITFPETRAVLLDNIEKYARAGQATDENMAHAHCILGN